MFSGCVGMAGMPYPPICFQGAWVWQGCHTLLNVFWLRGYGKDAIPSYFSCLV